MHNLSREKIQKCQSYILQISICCTHNSRSYLSSEALGSNIKEGLNPNINCMHEVLKTKTIEIESHTNCMVFIPVLTLAKSVLSLNVSTYI